MGQTCCCQSDAAKVDDGVNAPVRAVRVRAREAMIGSVVGDAAAQTSHWNYKVTDFHTALREAKRFDSPEFFVNNGFYTVPVGGQSCYGDQVLCYGRHLLLHGELLQDELIADLMQLFGPDSSYGPYPVAGKPNMPISGPWRHGSLKSFLTNVAAGKLYPDTGATEDTQADLLARVVPVCCVFAGTDNLLVQVEVAVRIVQNNDTAVAYAKCAALILESLIMGTATDAIGAITVAKATMGDSFPLPIAQLGTFLKTRSFSSLDDGFQAYKEEPWARDLLQGKSVISAIA